MMAESRLVGHEKVSAMTQTGTVPRKLLLDSRAVAALSWRPFAGRAGLYDRVLWQDPTGKSSAGLLHMDPGTSVPPHLHPRATHHLWVASGSCTIDGRTLDGGSYVFVPACRMHGIPQVGRAGCVVFYLYLHQTATHQVSGPPHRSPGHLTDEQQVWAAAAALSGRRRPVARPRAAVAVGVSADVSQVPAGEDRLALGRSSASGG
jgi:quercetin dioxygenase-like cupin family protein